MIIVQVVYHSPKMSQVTSTEGEATTSSSTFDVGERADSSSDHVTSQSDHVTTVQDRLGTYSGTSLLADLN